ncbi:MAG: chemotaxis protein CheW [Cyclobacteriaceae bacterium]|nr:chemotaxis protein CheW [Cyclobacteriaceae bacterium]
MENAGENKEKQTNGSEGSFTRYQLIVFKQGEEEYAMHIDQIKEVVITPNITRMPQTSSYIKGVANIRGNIIAIVDLEEKFGLGKTNAEVLNHSKNFTLVIESEEFKIGLLVKEVPNTLTVTDKDIDESVNIVGDGAVDKNYIKGIVKVDKRLIILIDIYKVMSKEELGKTITAGV